jgi:DNA-directed RNA polymerase subunit RPC12/RpoP
MTREDRWIVSLDEVQGLRWRCARCSVSVSYALDETIRIPTQCPSCGLEVIPDDFTENGKIVRSFIATLKALRRTEMPVKLFLEFDARPGL